MPDCRICGSQDADEPIALREMMFGTREEFDYFRCRDCDTLQICVVPDDLSPFYPDNYYSFKPRRRSIRARVRTLIKGHDLPEWAASLDRRSRVLDIGCGSGAMLHDMKSWGFRSLFGYDPYCTPSTMGGVRVSDQKPVGETFDVVMMHHSIEHVPDPARTLAEAGEWLAPSGLMVIRIPVRQGWAWREYGTNWVHLDPPRHLYHWTVAGFTRFVEQCGFAVVDQGFDGTIFSLLASPLYAKDISQIEHKHDIPEGLLRFANDLNEAGDGDCAWFILRRA